MTTTSRYTVDSAAPIPIYPAGSKEALTVLNDGAAPCYLSDTASDLVGYPLAAGGAVTWAAGTPLYARVDSGADPTTVRLNSAVGVLPFGSVGVAGAIKTASLEAIGAIDAPFYTLDRFTSSPFGSIVVAAEGVATSGTDMIQIVVTWYDALTGAGIVGQDQCWIAVDDIVTSRNVLTCRVKGPYCIVSVESTSIPVNVTDWSVRVYGQSATVPDGYITDGDGGMLAQDKWSYADSLTVAHNTSYTLYPGSIAGPVIASCRLHAAVGGGQRFVFAARAFGTGTVSGATIYREQFDGPLAANFSCMSRFIAPRSPWELVLFQDTGANMTISVGLTFEGNN